MDFGLWNSMNLKKKKKKTTNKKQPRACGPHGERKMFER